MLLKYIIFGFFSLGITNLAAQNVYTQLKEEHSIQIFTAVSKELVCQCGCNYLLSVCPHVECPWAIPARRFIEDQVRAGDSVQSIVEGFEDGLGQSLYEIKTIQKILEGGHDEFVKNLAGGYGKKVLARSSLFAPLLLIVAAFCFGLVMFSYWYKRNKTGNPLS